MTEAKRAVELDPLQPGHCSGLALDYYGDRDYEQGLKELQKIRELEPNSKPFSQWDDPMLHVEKGMYKEAIAESSAMPGTLTRNNLCADVAPAAPGVSAAIRRLAH